MRMKIFMALILVSFLVTFQAFAEVLQVGPVYMEKPGELSAVVELPPGTAPQASEFRLMMNRKAVATANAVNTFGESGNALALVLCVDVSGSMNGGPLRDIKHALLSFIGEAANRPEDRIALISFADDAITVSSFDKPREQLADAVLKLKTRGGHTRIYHALYKALDSLQRPDLPKRRRVIVISDGKDEGSIETLENVTTKTRALGIPIDAVGRGKIDREYQQVLSGLAESAGGQFVEADPDTLSLKDAIARVYRDLLETRSFVVYFSYETDQAAGKTEDASIEMTRSGENALVAAIPGQFPLPKPKQIAMPENNKIVPHQPPDYWLWLRQHMYITGFIMGFLLLMVALLIILALRRPKGEQKKGEDGGEVEQVVENREPFQEPAVSRGSPFATLVGGYFFPPPEKGKATAVLKGIEGPRKGKLYNLEKELFHIGSEPGNDLQIAEDEFVSRKHASLRYERGSLFIADEGSRNGTFVNEKRITETYFNLNPGDCIQVGKSIFQIEKG